MFTGNNLNLKEYIHANFDVIYKSDLVDDVSDADEFLITEQHDSPQVKRANALFINTFKTKNSIVFYEGDTSLLPPKNPLGVCRWLQLENEDINLFGWDSQDQFAIACRYYGIDSFNKLCLKTAGAISECGNAKLVPLHNMLMRKWLGGRVYKDSVLRAEFPARTESMINTLKGIENLRLTKNLNGRIFLIAGTYHLIEPELYNEEGVRQKTPGEFLLTTLYDELKNRKVVILKSKLNDPVIKKSCIPYKLFEEIAEYSSRDLSIDFKQIDSLMGV